MLETNIPEQFFDLMVCTNWCKNPLDANGKRILSELLAAAGFTSTKIVMGNLRGRWQDQDGYTGETYPINCMCPYKVLSDNDDDYLATGWLDCMVRFSRELHIGSFGQKKMKRDDAVKALAEKTEQANPLKPIVLTEIGDTLSEYPPSTKFGGYEYFVDHARDTNKLSTCVGVHTICHGWMDRNRATATHDAISCRCCHLRITFPKSVKTYGDLRTHFAQFN